MGRCHTGELAQCPSTCRNIADLSFACSSDRSGFDGPWTFSPTTFTNDYFKLLFDEKWSWRKWKGPAQFTDSKTKTLMMLPTDVSLTKDKEFKKYAKAYAEDQDLFFKE